MGVENTPGRCKKHIRNYGKFCFYQDVGPVACGGGCSNVTTVRSESRLLSTMQRRLVKSEFSRVGGDSMLDYENEQLKMNTIRIAKSSVYRTLGKHIYTTLMA